MCELDVGMMKKFSTVELLVVVVHHARLLEVTVENS
jgi:hypothetical protein